MKTGEIILNQYRIDKKLGEGGFGAVYQARHLSWNVDLAIKVPKPEIVARTEGVEAFEQEAETWVNLGLHPHTVSCYYVRRLDRNPLVFAEYVAGGSLHDWIRGRKLYEGGQEASLEKILDIAIQFAWGLDFSHEQGLIHQDVKPENVMMTPGGVVKVTDFGLAKGRVVDAVTTLANGTVVTEAGAMTPAYCSPEQAGKETLTRRTDLWSWAVSVLEMFVGERTWQSGSIAGYCLENYLQQEPKDSTLPQMPDKVAELLSHCFQENPSKRPRTMVNVANRLQEIYQQETGKIYPRQEPKAASNTADSLNNRAVSLFDLGKQEEALRALDQTLRLQPQHLEAIFNQGIILWRWGKIDDMTLLKMLESARVFRPGDWYVDYLIASVHLENSDCEAAITILESIQVTGKDRGEVQSLLKEARHRLCQHIQPQCTLTLTGHTDSVTSVCLSANGRFALSGSWDKSVKLWEISTGKCLRTFEGHTNNVTSVCLSADGRFALSGSCDKTLRLWEVVTGQCLHTFEGHTDMVTSVCLSADSRFAFSGSFDGNLRLWDLYWELEDRLPTDWDEGARPYLENFLVLHTPYAATLLTDRKPTEAEITLALTHRGTPTWTEEDFQNLLYTLGCAGYGWLRPEGIKQQLQAMVGNRQKPSVSPLPNPFPKLGRGAKGSPISPISSTPTNKQSPISSIPTNKQSPISSTPINKQSPISSTPINKQSLANIAKFWVSYFTVFLIATIFNLGFLATAIASLVLALPFTWIWVRLSR